MTLHDFRSVIHHLGLVTPFNDGFWVVAQTEVNPTDNEISWEHYQWNPPAPFPEINQGVVHWHCREYEGTFDETASPKPTWADLTQALTDIALINARSTRIQRVSIEETRRICEQYLEGQLRSDQSPTVQLEILYRLRAPNPELTLRDSERDRLHDVATSILINLETATTTDELIDPADDDLWTDD